MSYQLIHTSAPRLMDSTSAGYGTVAMSEHLPHVLRSKLGALSVFREPRGGAATTGPQFSYHIIDHAGKSWHVLSCVQPAGADYSGRACHIAHHLVLTPEEVEAALADEQRPTPAGVALALLNNGFWKSEWKGEPAYLTGEPELRPGDMPAADAQPTWKLLTGHKANARAFFTHPYDRECLITLPPGTPVQQALGLLHESDWLTHTRGWGVTFTTAADDADTFTETLRMVCTPASPLVQRAIRTGHPVLQVGPGLEIPLPVPSPPGSLPVSPAAGETPPGGLMRAVARSVTHYHYTEEADWLLYDVDLPRRRGRWVVAAGCLALVASVAGAGYYYLAEPSGTPGSLAGMPLPVEGPSPAQPGVHALSMLIEQPYSHDETVRLMRRFSGLSGEDPEDMLLHECASLVLAAQQQGVRHIKVMKRLCECARLLGVKDSALVSLYLHEATNGMPVEEWQKQFSGDQFLSWLELKNTEPQLADIMSAPALKDYAPGALPAPPPTMLATADTSTPQPEKTPEEGSTMPDRVSLIPQTAVGGDALPPALEAALPHLPMPITSGTYVVSRFATGGVLEAAKRLELSPDGYHLYITPTETEGVFRLKPEHKDGKPAHVPTVEISVKAGRLHRIRSGENEAVVSFPVPGNEQFLTNVVLVPSFALPIPRGTGLKLPPVAKVDLSISPDELEVQPPSKSSPQARLVLKKNRKFPWSLSRKEVENIHFSLELPVLAGHNSVLGNAAARSGYVWKKSTVVSENGNSTQFKCEVEYRPNLPECLERRFEEVANTPCCGESPKHLQHLTLGNLYYIVCALANEKLSSSERNFLLQSYYRLFADETNNEVLRKILEGDPALYLTPKEATGRGLKARNARKSMGKMLAERQVRDRLRSLVCGVLSRSLIAAYTQEQKNVEAAMSRNAVFTLDRIDVGNHVELIWKFRAHKNNQKKP